MDASGQSAHIRSPRHCGQGVQASQGNRRRSKAIQVRRAWRAYQTSRPSLMARKPKTKRPKSEAEIRDARIALRRQTNTSWAIEPKKENIRCSKVLAKN